MAAIPALHGRTARGMPRWPLFLIGSPAAVAVWSGWVALGAMCGFGPVNLLPGVGSGFTLNTAITLPVGVEAYGAYALGAWLTPGTPERARRFARCSAVGALILGAAGQVIYHLLAAAHDKQAPWLVVVFVSCLPVVALGFGAALAHLMHAGSGDVQVARGDELQVTPQVTSVSAPQVTRRGPVQVTLWTKPDPLPQVMTQIAARPAVQVTPEAPVQVTPRVIIRSPLKSAFRSPRRMAYRVPVARRYAAPQVTLAHAPGHPPAQPPERSPGHHLNGVQAAPQVTSLQSVQVTPPDTAQATPRAVRQVTPRRRSRAARKRVSQVTPGRPSDSDLEPRVRSLLDSDPGVSVKAAAKVLGTGRDRARRLLDAERHRHASPVVSATS